MKTKRKFKVWDKKNKKWITPDFIGQVFINMDGDPIWWSNEGFRNINDEVDIVYSTGLKDKNNKEAFDRDTCIIYLKDGIQEKMVIRWVDPIAGFQFMDDNNGFWRLFNTPFEIIGNEFEGETKENASS